MCLFARAHVRDQAESGRGPAVALKKTESERVSVCIVCTYTCVYTCIGAGERSGEVVYNRARRASRASSLARAKSPSNARVDKRHAITYN